MIAVAFDRRPERHPELVPAWGRDWYRRSMQQSEIALRSRIDAEVHEACVQLREYRRRFQRSDDAYFRGVTERRIRETSRSLEHWRALRREGLEDGR